jgi:hypothetical protein
MISRKLIRTIINPQITGIKRMAMPDREEFRLETLIAAIKNNLNLASIL